MWKDNQDNLFFGGTYGFNNFLPQNIHKSSWLPNLCISGISIGGKAANENGFVVLNPEGGQPLNYPINRKDNFFELNIKALSFLNAEKCEYAYYLEGYDKAWHYAGTSGKIMYSNILPGNYTFKNKMEQWRRIVDERNDFNKCRGKAIFLAYSPCIFCVSVICFLQLCISSTGTGKISWK